MKRLSFVLAIVAIAGCATTSEMPLAPNVVRLDTQASGLLYTSSAPQITMKKAAEATLARGYTHFRLDQAQTSQGREFAGMMNSGQASGSATTYGNSTYANVSGTSYSTPIYQRTANIGVTVIMLRAGDPGFEGAFDAATVLRNGGKA